MSVVGVKHLYKSYSGKTAVKDLSFSVDPGEIKEFGHPMKESFKNQIGYLPEERGLYKKLSAIDLIVYLATLKGMDKQKAERKASALLEQTGMLENKRMKEKQSS